MKLWKRFIGDLNRFLNAYPLLFCIVVGIMENFVAESIGRHSVFACLRHIWNCPLNFLYNALIMTLFLVIALFFRRRIFAVVLCGMPWLLLACVNGAILSYRVTPLCATDLRVAKMSMLFVYLSPWQMVAIGALIVALIVALVFLWKKAPKTENKHYLLHAVISFVVVAAALGAATKFGLQYGLISNRFGNLVGAYEEYGFAYCFSSSVLDSGIHCPPDYSRSSMERLTAQLSPDTSDEVEERPDIVLIQLESFLDPKLIKGAFYDKDPVPFFTELKKTSTSGRLVVPSFGGGTSNTEFEVLTGMSMDFFGAGEYPYKTIMLKTTSESLAYNLKSLGYSAHALHNHTGNFYDRNKVYANLGFDTFASVEYMNDVERTQFKWAKDKILTDEIMQALTLDDGAKQKFVWAVSVQGHGKYPSEPVKGEELRINVRRGFDSDETRHQMAYYATQLSEMDDFLRTLTERITERGVPTMVIAYGDHLPGIDVEDFDLKTGNIYETEYVIWNNFGLPTDPEHRTLQANELAAYVQSLLGMNRGVFTRYHQDCAGNEDFDEGLEKLQYDLLYGDAYAFGGMNPFAPTQLQMGTLPITVQSVRYYDGRLYVHGRGFTEKSKIFLNGEKCAKTVFLSPQSLVLKIDEPSDGTVLTVGQASSRMEVLSYTQEVLYHANDGNAVIYTAPATTDEE